MAGGQPLYLAARSARRGGDGHAGLWYDKFCDLWRDDRGRWSMSASEGAGPKAEWIERVTGSAVGTDGDRLTESAHRLIRLVQARAGWVEVFTAQERFVTGLGRSHPVENGFAWHPTLGTPYLPGSSLKGLTRAWAVEQGQIPYATQLLGGPTSVGKVVLLDAVPVEPVWLEADVMTPHYAGWGPADPPGDWRSPRPIPFLVAAAGTSLLVGVFPRQADPDGSACGQLREWLQGAFETAGAGAKTAVGYGRFRPDPDQTAKLMREVAKADQAGQARREREQMLATPEGRWQVRVREATEHQVQALVREQLEAGHLADQVERVALARAVAGAGYLERWRRGRTATETGARKLKALSQVVAAVLAQADDR